MAELVKRLTLALVMISQFLSSSPTLGSFVSVELALEPLSPFLSAPPLLPLSLSLSLSPPTQKKKIKQNKEWKDDEIGIGLGARRHCSWHLSM